LEEIWNRRYFLKIYNIVKIISKINFKKSMEYIIFPRNYSKLNIIKLNIIKLNIIKLNIIIIVIIFSKNK